MNNLLNYPKVWRQGVAEALVFARNRSENHTAIWVVQPDKVDGGYNIRAYSIGYKTQPDDVAEFYHGFQENIGSAKAWLIEGRWVVERERRVAYPIRDQMCRYKFELFIPMGALTNRIRWMPERPPAYVHRFVCRRLDLPKGVI
jgi:hypothetical protein